MNDDPLAERHRYELEVKSGIDPAIIAERGYRTVLGKTYLQPYGFNTAQQKLIPGLLLPTYNVEGREEGATYKPDHPREFKRKDGTDKSRIVKYEHAPNKPPVIDIHPRIHPLLSDPAVELWITEGQKKADSAISRGLCCIALPGVWNWRGANDYGGKTALPQWEIIALNDRRVVIAYDNDAMVKLEVQQALDRLTGFLQRRGADVHHCRLPWIPDGDKVGLDDYFVAGGSVEALRAYIHPAGDQADKPQFFARNDETYRRGIDRQGNENEARIANFVWVVAEDIGYSDGDEDQRTYTIRMRHKDGEVVTVRILATDWNDVRTARKALLSAAGPQFIIEQGQFEAMQLAALKLSEGRTEKRTYHTATGWIGEGPARRFVTPSIAIGPDGPDHDVFTDIDGPGIENYGVLWPDKPEHAVYAWNALEAVVKAATPRVALPLLAQVVSAPIDRLAPVDKPVLLHLVGDTGVFKTTYATLILNLFGTFDREQPPLSWTATTNALERAAFTLRDLPVLIDDFKLGHIKRHDDLVRFIQNYGDRTSRQRLRADLTFRRSYPVRGVLISTGEDVPEGEASMLGRMLILGIETGDIDPVSLGAAQAASKYLAMVGARYLAWLCLHYETIAAKYQDRYSPTRDFYASNLPGAHNRIPVAAARMDLAFDVFTDFLIEEWPDRQQIIQGWADGLQSELIEIGKLQSERVYQERAGNAFMEWLSGAIATGQIRLDPLGSRDARWIGGERAPVAGWYHYYEGVFIAAQAAWGLYQRATRADGKPLTWSRDAVWKQLATDGHTERHEDGRATTRKRVSGLIVRCLHFGVDKFGDLAQAEHDATDYGRDH